MNPPDELLIPLADHPQYRLGLAYEDEGFGIDERNYIVWISAKDSHVSQATLIFLIHDMHDIPPMLSHAGRVYTLQFGRIYFHINHHDAPTLQDWLEQCRDYERYLEGEHAT